MLSLHAHVEALLTTNIGCICLLHLKMRTKTVLEQDYLGQITAVRILSNGRIGQLFADAIKFCEIKLEI